MENITQITPQDQDLVQTSGANFEFCDRQASIKILADNIAGRFQAFKQGLTDRNLHRIPYLADGPGSGKSRFLQELPRSFRDYVLKSDSYPDDFKETIKNAIFLNITFGNASRYLPGDIRQPMSESLGLRVSYILEKLQHLRSTRESLVHLAEAYSRNLSKELAERHLVSFLVSMR
jgi:hypothetical protein